MAVVIYGVFDKGSGDCLYVGRSGVFSMRKRQHEKCGPNTSKALRKYVNDNNVSIEVRVLEKLDYYTAPASREKYWISFYKGDKLLNKNAVHEGTIGFSFRLSTELNKAIIDAANEANMSKNDWILEKLISASE
jgi:hypothetical protein